MMNDYYAGIKLSQLEPLTQQQLRDLWVAAPYPETKALLWEIKRLHKIITSLHRNMVAMMAGYTGGQIALEGSARGLLCEPCVHAYIARADDSAAGLEADPEKWLHNEVSRLRAVAQARGLGYGDKHGDGACADESGKPEA